MAGRRDACFSGSGELVQDVIHTRHLCQPHKNLTIPDTLAKRTRTPKLPFNSIFINRQSIQGQPEPWG